LLLAALGVSNVERQTKSLTFDVLRLTFDLPCARNWHTIVPLYKLSAQEVGMMQVRCQRCGWMTTLGREAIALALAEAQQAHEQYHMLDCPHCRRAIKVQVSELRRKLPANYPLPQVPPPAPSPPAESSG
jgi:hypothetical protein